jgi:hypothetical protein
MMMVLQRLSYLVKLCATLGSPVFALNAQYHARNTGAKFSQAKLLDPSNMNREMLASDQVEATIQ